MSGNNTLNKDAGVEEYSTEEDVTPSATIRNGLRTYGWIAVVGWCVFEVLRRKLSRAYYCRDRSGETSSPTVENARGFGAFRWIYPLYTTSDDAVFQYCGLDTLFFLRFLRLVQKVAAFAIVFSAALFPIYYYAGASGNDALYRMTLSSLTSKEPWRFWFAIAMMYCITAWTCWLLLREFQEFVKRRHEFMSRKGAQQYSVVLSGLPKHLSTQQTLRNYLNLLFPRQVLHVYVAVECSDLEKLVAERVKVRNKLEHALALSAKTGDRVLVREKLVGGDKVDAIELYQGHLKSLNDAVEMEVRAILRNQAALANQMLEASTDGEGNYAYTPTAGADDRAAVPALQTIETTGANDETKSVESAYIKGLRQEKGKGKNIKSTGIMRGAGFVTFNSLRAAQAAQQVLQSSDPTAMQIEAAPFHEDVVWANIGVTANQKSYWLLISVALTSAIILFWTIPTGFIVALSKVDSLEKNWPWLAGVVKDNSWLAPVLEQVSPLMLSVMSALAPIIFGILSKREGHATASQVTTSLLNKLVAYQVFLVFLLPIIGGTLIDTVMGQAKDGEDIKDIGALVKKVSKAIPQQSSFFITFLIVQTFVNLTLEFLRVTPIVKAYIYQAFAPKLTPRERASPWFGLAPLSVPGTFGATDGLSQYYTVLIFVLVFCSVAPIMSYFALLYLFLSDVVYRWAVLCVYDPSPHSDGAYFPSLYRFCIGALIFSQVIIATLLGTKEVALPAAFALALPFLTALFHVFVNARYPRTAMNLPLNECVLVDSRRARKPEDLDKVLEDVYRQPAMTEREALEPDYAGLSSDPNEHHQLSSPPASEKFSGVFIMGDGSSGTATQAAATTTHHTRTPASTAPTVGSITLLSPQYSAMHSPLAFSSIAVSQSERSRSDSDYSSRASLHALPKRLQQHRHLPPASASNPLPVLVHVKKERVLLGALVFCGALVALTLVLSRGIVIARFEAPFTGTSGRNGVTTSDSFAQHARRVDDYNAFVGAATALTIKPLLALVALVVPAALLCFATRSYMQTQWSWRTQAALFLVTNVIVWLLSNGFSAANVHFTAPRIEPALRSADLAVEKTNDIAVDSTSLVTADLMDVRNTVLRSAIGSHEQLEPIDVSDSECTRASPRRLPALVDFGFPTREWLRDVLPTAPAPLGSLRFAVSDMASAASAASDRAALPVARSTAQSLFTAALYLMDDFFLDPAATASASSNSSTLELTLPIDYDTGGNDSDTELSTSTSRKTMETALLDAMRTKLRKVFGAASPLAHFTRFRAEPATLEFARYELSPQIAFDAVTFDVPLVANELRRRVVLQSDGSTTESVVYGNDDGVFEMNAREECSPLGCVVSSRGERSSAARVDAGSQVHALAMCIDSATNADDWRASVGAADTACSSTSDRSALVFSFAKRIVGDELDSTAGLVTLTNATKYYTVTVGRLAWTVSDLAETFHAACKAPEGCNGLSFPLRQQQQESDSRKVATERHVVVGASQLPRARTYSRELRQRWATQLVGLDAQDVDDSGTLKSDLVLPRNFKHVVAWGDAVSGEYCEVERARFLRRVVQGHLYSEHSLQPAYTAALYWLLQRAVVRDALTLSMEEASTTTLAFSGNIEVVHAELSVPRGSAALTCAGCAVLLLLALAVQLGGKRREAHIERFFTPHQLAQLVLGDSRLPHHVVKCDVLRVANDRLGSSEHLDEFEISGLALRHCKDPGNVLYVPKQTSTASSSAISAA